MILQMSLWGKVFCSRIRDVYPGESVHFFSLPRVITWPSFSVVQITFLLGIVENAALIDVRAAAGLVGHPLSRERVLPAPSRPQHAPNLPPVLWAKEILAASQGNLIMEVIFTRGESERCILVLLKCSGFYCHGFTCIKTPLLIYSNVWAFQMFCLCFCFYSPNSSFRLSLSLLPSSSHQERMMPLCTRR